MNETRIRLDIQTYDGFRLRYNFYLNFPNVIWFLNCKII
ncbi:hypothetical protein V6Z11_A06G162800 [Gossypium hirsutum]